jgi:uncharacterized OB-fold protein
MDLDQSELQREPLRLLGSRDPKTGQTYFPPRTFSVDGKMRETALVELSPKGILHTWTTFGRVYYGQVDLPEGIRIQCELEGSEHEIGAQYELCTADDNKDRTKWRFRRA